MTLSFFCGNVQANQLDDSVADYYENPEKHDENTKKIDIKESQPAKLNIGFLDFVKMLAALGFVIILLYYLLKFINKRSQSYQQNRLVQHFGGTPLGGNRSIQIVKAGKRILIIGVGEDIRLLKEITDEDELEQFTLQYERQLDQSLQPADMISKLGQIWKGRNAKTAQSNQKPFHHHLQEQLDDIKSNRRQMLNKLGKKEQDQDE